MLADEGMWTFDNLPLKHLKATYGFEPPPGWAEHLQSAAVRFNSGGSGSFVSPDGLVMTNHHVAADMLQKISTKEQDYYKTGFHARTHAEEVKAPDLELNVLVGIADVTDQVNAAVRTGWTRPPPTSPGAGRWRRSSRSRSTRPGSGATSSPSTRGGSTPSTPSRSTPTSAWSSPPSSTSPSSAATRTTSSIPATTSTSPSSGPTRTTSRSSPKHFLAWSATGSKAGDLTFVAGHPGRTSRLNTVAHLEYLRDHATPLTMELLRDREAFLLEYGKLGPEQSRQSKEDLFGIQNSRKARAGGLKGLQRPRRDGPQGRGRAGPPRQDRRRPRQAGRLRLRPGTRSPRPRRSAEHRPDAMLTSNAGSAFDSPLFGIARTLVRLAAEKAQAQRRPPPRVPRLGARIAPARTLLRGPDLPRLREGQARPLARLLASSTPRATRCWSGAPRPDARAGGAMTSSAGRSSATSPSARPWPTAGCTPSRPATTR